MTTMPVFAFEAYDNLIKKFISELSAEQCELLRLTLLRVDRAAHGNDYKSLEFVYKLITDQVQSLTTKG